MLSEAEVGFFLALLAFDDCFAQDGTVHGFRLISSKYYHTRALRYVMVTWAGFSGRWWELIAMEHKIP